MSIRSHVDPATFVRILYIDSEGLEPKIVNALEAELDYDAFSEIWKAERARRFETIIHETYHFWQGVRLPYVHRYAVLSFFRIFQAFMFAARQFGDDFSKWQFELPELYRLTVPVNCYLLDNHSFALEVGTEEFSAPANTRAQFRLTERDLLETGASLAEWNAYVGHHYKKREALIDKTLFGRWRKRFPAFLEAFDMVARALDSEELALRCALPLICGAFSTTRPVVTLCKLLTDLGRAHHEKHSWWQGFVRQPEPCRWVELVERLIDQIDFDSAPDSDAELLSKKYCKLTLDFWANGTWNDTAMTLHPFLSERAQKWLHAEESTLPGLRWFMSQPSWVGEAPLHFALEIEPPLTIARISLPSGRTRVVTFRDFIEHEPVFGIPETGNIELLEIMTAVGIIKRATGSHFHPMHRLCSHSECPHFHGNYCNSYFNIPRDYMSCGFPSCARTMIARFNAERSV